MGTYKLVPQIRCSKNLYWTETIVTAKFRDLLVQKYFQMEIFLTVYLPTKCFTKQEHKVFLSQWSPKTLGLHKKGHEVVYT